VRRNDDGWVTTTMRAMNFHPLDDGSTPPRTIYRDTEEPAPATMPLDGDATADVAIIGGGFTGLSAALHAAEKGLRAVVLEANEIGFGSSGRNEGQVVPAMKQEPAHAERTFGRARGQRLMEAAGAGPDLVFGLIERFSIQCAASRCGIITAAHSASSLERMRQRTRFWQERGAPVEMLERAAAEAMIGGAAYVGGSLDRRGGVVNPLGYVRGLARAAQSLGAHIHTKTMVTGIKRSSSGWTVETATGSVAAANVLICTNAYASELWPGLHRAIVPVRAYQLVTKPLGENVRNTILPGGHALSDTKRVMVGMRRYADGRLQLGGGGVTTGPDRAPFFGHVERHLRRLFPQLTQIEWETTWSGWMAMTPDRYPRLHELAPGLLAGFGYNGRGVAMGTIMGRELARRVAGEPLEDLAIPATPLQPIPGHALRRAIVFARLHYYRLRDALDEFRR
jgi:glycine/D-amino acid oxidase-like deaminating enzyme